MIAGSDIPKVAGVPPGADFVRVIFDRLSVEHAGKQPEDLARTTVLVPTRRMQRRLKQLYLEDGSYLLPAIGLVSDVGSLLAKPIEARPVSWLHRHP